METLAFWTNASIILLCIEAIILTLIPAFLFYYSIKGLWALDKKMRAVSPKVQRVFREVNRVTHETSDKIAEPVFRVNATTAQVHAMGRRTASLLKRREV